MKKQYIIESDEKTIIESGIENSYRELNVIKNHMDKNMKYKDMGLSSIGEQAVYDTLCKVLRNLSDIADIIEE